MIQAVGSCILRLIDKSTSLKIQGALDTRRTKSESATSRREEKTSDETHDDGDVEIRLIGVQAVGRRSEDADHVARFCERVDKRSSSATKCGKSSDSERTGAGRLTVSTFNASLDPLQQLFPPLHNIWGGLALLVHGKEAEREREQEISRVRRELSSTRLLAARRTFRRLRMYSELSRGVLY